MVLAGVAVIFSCSDSDDKPDAAPGGGAGSGGSAGAAGSSKGGDSSAGSNAGGNGESGGSSEGGTGGAAGGASPSEPCVVGMDSCENANPDHCSVECQASEAGPVCVHSSLDADGDGHGDAACTESEVPGDDCNDSPLDGADVHPGADEICNALIDDDCDGEDETTDEVVLAAASGVVAQAIGTTRRDDVALAANSTGNFEVAWTDYRNDGTDTDVYFNSMTATGVMGTEAQTNVGYAQNSPGLVGSGDFFKLTWVSQPIQADPARLYWAYIDPFGLGSETSFTVSPIVLAPQPSATAYYVQNNEFVRCEGAACVDMDGATANDATTFDASPDTDRVVYESGGDLFVSVNGSAPTKLAETTAENRTNPVITEVGGLSRVAYRFESGIRIGTGACEFSDGIPIDIAKTSSDDAVLLYWNPAQSSLHVRVIDDGCTQYPSALVAEENDTTITSAAVAVNPDDVIAVVWSSKTGANEWTIQRRIFGPALCE